MKKIHENKFTMLKAVEAYLDSNAETVNSVPELAEHSENLKSLCSRISLKDEEKRTVVLGKSLKKDKERNDAVSKALAVNGALFAYALKTGNIELEQKSRMPVSFFSRLRDTEFLSVLNTIKDMAIQYRSELVPYGITEDKLNSFSSKIESYAAALGQREISTAMKTTATQTIESLFEDAISLMKSIDGLVNGLAEDNPGFVSDYYNARSVRNLGKRYRKDESSIVNLSAPNTTGSQ